MKKMIPLIFSILLSPIFSFAGTFSIPRSDGTQITFYLDLPSTNSFPILIGFQGSVCVTSFPMHQMLKSALLPLGIAVLSVEKRGLGPDSKNCPGEYIQKNTVQDRALDHLAVMQMLNTNSPISRKNIYLTVNICLTAA